MENFSHYLPARVHFGRGVLRERLPEAGLLGRKALVVTGRGSARSSGLLH